MDKKGRKFSMFLNSATMILSGVILCFAAAAGSSCLATCGLILAGLGFGGCPALSSSVIYMLFGEKNYAVNFSANNFLLIPAALIGPLISGKLQDISGGDYFTTFLMIAILGAIAWVLNIFMNKCS
jgi:OFA family oxalate/formate antiporter-like MFS transporter